MGRRRLKLRLPKALPAIFSALKINMLMSIIGAIVGEFFIASRGLGYLLSDQIRLVNMPLAWACIVIAAILGIVLYTIISTIRKPLYTVVNFQSLNENEIFIMSIKG